MKITLIGLGTDTDGLSKRAETALKSVDKIIVRTDKMPSFKNLSDYNVYTLDALYGKSRNFDTLNKNLANAILKESKTQTVAYCVDGAVCEDAACKIILSKHKDCEVIAGEAKSARAASLARLKSDMYTSVSAYAVEGLKSCPAAVVYDIDCYFVATKVKEVFTNLFGEETECTFIDGGSVKRIKVYELDRQKEYNLTCCAVIEEREFLKKDRYDFADLERLIKLLRAPGGCAWDRAQTNESIKPNLIEEAYELADAIERGDDDGIEEETGDVLLQAAFHAVLKEEQGVFNGTDAITRLVKKLIFRHSHIFGKDKAETGEEALNVWERNKNVEKHAETFGQTVEAVPKNFPACMRAQKVQKRAAKSGMDFLSSVSAAERLTDELKELITALVDGDEKAVFDEAGDVLFSAVNTCRLAKVDCEEALKSATEKFSKRFILCEKLIIADGKDITDLNELELNVYWQKAKDELKKH